MFPSALGCSSQARRHAPTNWSAALCFWLVEAGVEQNKTDSVAIASRVFIFGSNFGEAIGSRLMCSAADPLLQMCGIALTLYLDCGNGALNRAQVIRGQIDGNRSEVLLKAMQRRGAWDGSDPRLLRQQPCECNLSTRHVFPCCDFAKHFNQS